MDSTHPTHIRWRKSSRSGGQGGACVEVAAVPTPSTAHWRKSSRSAYQGGECVEVADLDTAIAVRDSKDPDGPHLPLTPAAWGVLARRIKAGAHDFG